MRKILLLTPLLLAATWVVHAQGITTASISGIVTDAQGEPLAGATVLAVHLPSGTEYGAATLPSGRFNIPAARIGGPYKITISFVGFQDFVWKM